MADITPAALSEAGEVPEIQERASLNEIRQRYHEQIKTWHPGVSHQNPACRAR